MNLDKIAMKLKDGPIPGENHLSSKKNYPWHSKPEITDIDDAIEESIKILFSKRASKNYMTLMELGYPIAGLTSLFLMLGVSKGKWSIDFALLLAGPVSHILKIMGDAAGVPYKMGTEVESEDDPSQDPQYLTKLSELAVGDKPKISEPQMKSLESDDVKKQLEKIRGSSDVSTDDSKRGLI